MPRAKCPCGTVLSVKSQAGEVVQCSQCGQKLRLRNPSANVSPDVADPGPPTSHAHPEPRALARPLAYTIPQAPASNPNAIESQATWLDMLNECKQRFGQSPRKFRKREKRYLKVTSGLLNRLVSSSDILSQPLAAQESVFRDGKVVWGYLIQANDKLFQPGNRNLPGEVVYSLGSPRITPEDLGQLAAELEALKGTQPTLPALVPVADYVTDEYTRAFGISVPRAVSAKPCLISSVYFVRDHLPNAMLSDNVLPLVVKRRSPHFAFVLPSLYWPDTLLQHWKAPRPEISG